MRGNNLSNKSAPYVLFDIDSLLFIEPEKNVWKSLKDTFKSHGTKYMERPINLKFINTLTILWHKHDISIGFVTFELHTQKEKEKLEELLAEIFVPYTRLMTYTEWEQLRIFNNSVHSIYTFSANDELLSYISSTSALHISKIGEVL